MKKILVYINLFYTSLVYLIIIHNKILTKSLPTQSVVIVSYLQTPIKWKTLPSKVLQCGSPEQLQVIESPHLTVGSPVFPAGHVHTGSPLLSVLQLAPVPQGFGFLSQIAVNRIHCVILFYFIYIFIKKNAYVF